MLTWKLAFRNLRRHKRRSLITASAIVFSYALMIIFQGMAHGGHTQMIDMGVRLGSGHVVVQAEGYQGEKTLDTIIHEPAPVLQSIADSGVEALVAPRLVGTGLARAGSKSVGVGIAGVAPAREKATNDLAADDKRVAGDWLRPRDELAFANLPSDVYLGSTLAETLAVGIGDRVALTVQPKDADEPRSAAFLVRGIFETGNDELDGFFVQVPLEDAQELLGVGDVLTQIALVLPDLERTEAVHATLAAALAGRGLEVLPWQEALPELYEFVVLDDASMYLFMGILFILVALGIFNTVLASVIERTREFGLLMAIGSRPRRQFRLVMTEALLIGVFGLLFGLAIGLAGNAYLTTNGIDFAAIAGEQAVDAGGINMAIVMYSKLTPFAAVASFVTVFLIVILSALWPAARAARLEPLEALHHV